MKLAAALAVAATLALPAANAAEQQRVLGIDTTVLGMRLAWYDPATLTRLPGRTVPLVSHSGAWSLSPDRTQLAIGGSFAADDLRLLDVKRMRARGSVRLGLGYAAASVSWPRANRLLAAGGRFVAVVDPLRLRVVRRTRLAGVVEDAAPLQDGLVLLLGQEINGFAAAKLAVADVEGHVRTATLDRITIGFRKGDGTYEVRRAGFALDPVTRRAFVVGADDTISVVDLRSLDVSYHASSTRSLAKELPGPQRTARWLGGGLLGIAGSNGFYGEGLRIVDTRDWSTRVVDHESEGLRVGAGFVVGSRWQDFAVYGLDGSLHYRLELEPGQELQVAGRYGYACHGVTLARVIDLASGATLSTATQGAQAPVCPTVLSG